MVMLIRCAILKFPMMKNEVLGARCCFGSYTKWGPTKASKCNFKVPKCSLEVQNGHASTQIHSNNTKCVLISLNTPMVHLGLVWLQLVVSWCSWETRLNGCWFWVGWMPSWSTRELGCWGYYYDWIGVVELILWPKEWCSEWLGDIECRSWHIEQGAYPGT